MLKEKEIFEPYRFLFPTGVVSAVAGISLWIFFRQGWVEFYPRQAHANMMFFGFLWSFIAGFLMTAIPKMTGTDRANYRDISTAIVFVLAQIVLNFFDQTRLSAFGFFFQIAFLLFFFSRRLLQVKKIPFEGFLFIPAAFFQALLGLGLFLFSDRIPMNTFLLLSGEAFVLNLVVGLGARLIPLISRVPNAITPQLMSEKKKYTEVVLCIIGINLGFWIQAFFNPQVGYALRFLTVGWMCVRYFKILTPVTTKGFVGLGLRCGLLFILISYALGIVDFEQKIAIQHLLYVGGFVLITFMVGSRVMLAHAGQNLLYETTSGRLGAVALLLGASSLFRLFAAANVQGTAMIVGIGLFLLALVLWAQKFMQILWECIYGDPTKTKSSC